MSKDLSVTIKRSTLFDILFFGILVFDILLIGFASYNIIEGLKKGLSAARSLSYVAPENKKTELPAARKAEALPVKEAVPAAAAAAPAPAPVSAPKKKEVRKAASAGVLVLDNFLDAAKNNVSGQRKSVSSYGGILKYGISTGAISKKKYLYIKYDVSSVESAGVYSTVVPLLDMSDYEYLYMEFKGGTGDEVFRIRISDGKTTGSVSSYELFPDAVPDRFTHVFIPLAKFGSLYGKKIKNARIDFVFSYNLGMPYQGTLFVRSVNLSKEGRLRR